MFARACQPVIRRLNIVHRQRPTICHTHTIAHLPQWLRHQLQAPTIAQLSFALQRWPITTLTHSIAHPPPHLSILTPLLSIAHPQAHLTFLTVSIAHQHRRYIQSQIHLTPLPVHSPPVHTPILSIAKPTSNITTRNPTSALTTYQTALTPWSRLVRMHSVPLSAVLSVELSSSLFWLWSAAAAVARSPPQRQSILAKARTAPQFRWTWPSNLWCLSLQCNLSCSQLCNPWWCHNQWWCNNPWCNLLPLLLTSDLNQIFNGQTFLLLDT